MCSHEKRVEDCHDGSEICTECGLVTSDRQIYKCANHQSNVEEDNQTWGWEFFLRNEILDILAIIHQDSRTIAEEVMIFIQSKMTEPIYIYKKAHRELIAYAIWETLNDMEFPRAPQEIAALCGVTPSSISKVQKKFEESPSDCSPSKYSDGICNMLGIPFRVSNIVRLAAEYLDGLMHKPESIIAVMILETISAFHLVIDDYNTQENIDKDEVLEEAPTPSDWVPSHPSKRLRMDKQEEVNKIKQLQRMYVLFPSMKAEVAESENQEASASRITSTTGPPLIQNSSTELKSPPLPTGGNQTPIAFCNRRSLIDILQISSGSVRNVEKKITNECKSFILRSVRDYVFKK